MRDMQKNKLYMAERVLDDHKYHFRRLADIQKYVDAILASEWWQDRSDVNEVTILMGNRNSGKAAAYPACASFRGKVYTHPFITLPGPWACTKRVVLHELAHVLTPTDVGHGPHYCGRFIEIVEEYMGRIDSKRLAKSMTDEGVKFTRYIPMAS